MKNIIQQIFASKASKKAQQLTAWVDELKDMDELTALLHSTKHLSLLANTEEGADGLSLQQELDLILNIEVLNKPRQEKLSTQFSSVENMKAELENNIAQVCYSYSRQSYLSHLKLIEKVFSNQRADAANTPLLDGYTPNILIGRAINAAFNMIKWRLFTHTNPPAKIWLQINILYKIATQKSLLNSPIQLFDLSPSTTLAAYYVQTCMFGQLAQASMKKVHIEIAARVLNTLLTHVHISNKFTPEQYLFYMDLDKDMPARRMREFEPTENCRYWELDELEKQLAVAITVSDRNEIPQSLSFSKINNAKKLNETLHILYEEWKKLGYTRQRRKSIRRASSKTARVNAGIVDICNQVRQANQVNSGLRLSRDGTSLDDRLRAHTVLRQTSAIASNSGSLDTWIITDESPHGLGARVNKYANILARTDKLIGLNIDGDLGSIVIGMIRSVKPTQGNQLRVGIEIISHHPSWVQLRQSRSNDIFAHTETEVNPLSEISNKNPTVDFGLFSGIYLPIEAGLSETSVLILPKLNYRANQYYNISLNGAQNKALLGEPIESRDDWVKVTYPF